MHVSIKLYSNWHAFPKVVCKKLRGIDTHTQAQTLSIENADHLFFQSKEAGIVQAIHAFIASLPNTKG